MSHDIRDILERLDKVGAPKQLPALFRPRDASPALNGPYAVDNVTRGYLVGEQDEEEEEKTALEEAMAEIEEDMLSKVKKDLTQYLDKLEKKMEIDRDLRDKAVDAVEKGQAEEDAVAEDPTAQDSEVTLPEPPLEDPTLPESAPVKTYTLEDGSNLDCYGDTRHGFEIRRGGRSLPSRFRSIDEADMAVKLWQAKKRDTDTNKDYMEEK
jgi:hypothetical protein